jgi:hypothetical protein
LAEKNIDRRRISSTEEEIPLIDRISAAVDK